MAAGGLREEWSAYAAGVNRVRFTARAGFGVGLVGYMYERYCGPSTPIKTPYVGRAFACTGVRACIRVRSIRAIPFADFDFVRSRRVPSRAVTHCTNVSTSSNRTVRRGRQIHARTSACGIVSCGSRPLSMS